MNKHDLLARRLQEATAVEARPLTPASEIRRRGARRRRTRHTALALSSVAVVGALGGVATMVLPQLRGGELPQEPNVAQVPLSPAKLSDPRLLTAQQAPTEAFLANYALTPAGQLNECGKVTSPTASRPQVVLDYAPSAEKAKDLSFLNYVIAHYDEPDPARQDALIAQDEKALRCTSGAMTDGKITTSTLTLPGGRTAAMLHTEDGHHHAFIKTSVGVVSVAITDQLMDSGRILGATQEQVLTRAADVYEGRQVSQHRDAGTVRAIPALAALPASVPWEQVEMHHGQPPVTIAACEPTLGWDQGTLTFADASGPQKDAEAIPARARLAHHTMPDAGAATSAQQQTLSRYTTCLAAAQAPVTTGRVTVDGIEVQIVMATSSNPDVKPASTTLLWADGNVFGHLQIATDRALASDPASLKDLASAAVKQR